MVAVHGLAQRLGQAEHGAGRPGIKRRRGEQLDRGSCRLKADHAPADVGQPAAVEERPQARLVAEARQQLRQERGSAPRDAAKGRGGHAGGGQPCGAATLKGGQQFLGQGIVEGPIGIATPAGRHATRRHRVSQPSRGGRILRRQPFDGVAAGQNGHRDRRVDPSSQRLTPRGGGQEHEVHHVGIDRIEAGPDDRQRVEAFLERRGDVGGPPVDRGTSRGNDGVRHACRVEIGGRPHPPGE